MAEENHMDLRTADDCIKDSYLQSYVNKVLMFAIPEDISQEEVEADTGFFFIGMN